MKKATYTELCRALRDVERVPEPSPADDFWRRFRARADLIPAEGRAGRRRTRPALWPRWVLGAATVLALAAIFLSIELSQLFSEPGHDARLSRIDEVNVFMEHRSVMIMNDPEHGGTLLWVAGAEEGISHEPNG